MVFVAAASASTQAATSGTVVTATIPTATSVSNAGCRPGTSATEFGSVTPGSSVVLAAGCTVTFGSSNGATQLRLWQRDRRGSALAAPTTGTPNSGWGSSGVSTVDDAGQDYAPRIALDRTGLLVEVNDSATLLTRRLLSNGTPDPGFGSAGVLGPPPLPTFHSADDGWDVLVDAQDRILVAGQDYDGATYDAFVARSTPNGGWDPSFGTGGVVTFDQVLAGDDLAVAVEQDRAGRYLFLARGDLGTTRQWRLTRLREDGGLDTSFGTGGHVIIGGAPNEDFLYRHRGQVFVQADDRIVVVAITNGVSSDLYATRLLPDGAVDSSYGTGGSTTFDFQGDRDIVRGAGVDDHGRLTMAVSTRTGSTWTLGTARVDPNGVPDTTWGTGGKRLYPSVVLVQHQEGDAFVEGDGSVMYVGATPNGVDADAIGVRLRNDGSIDTTFGSSGMLVVGGVGDNGARSIVRGVDGGYLIGAYSGATVSEIWSYSSHAIDDWNGTTRTWGTAPSMFAACLRAVSGAAAGWAVDANADCTTADPGWNGLPADATLPAALVASTATPTTTATATIQFGLKISSSQVPGRFLAPIAFEVVAT
ncbi:MAG: uncharacterized protein JWL76_1681 [Thermoleophilia bacterium]|nr:uncharacterized protein [Thermoleophilia bacterium]